MISRKRNCEWLTPARPEGLWLGAGVAPLAVAEVRAKQQLCPTEFICLQPPALPAAISHFKTNLMIK